MLFESAISARRAVSFGHDAEVALVLQYTAVTLPYDRMIVDEQDRNFLCPQSHHSQQCQAAIGMVAATLRPWLARTIDRDPPTAATLSRIPVRPKPAD